MIHNMSGTAVLKIIKNPRFLFLFFVLFWFLHPPTSATHSLKLHSAHPQLLRNTQMSDSQFCQVHWRDADLVNADIDWELEDLPDDSKVVAHSHTLLPSFAHCCLIVSFLSTLHDYFYIRSTEFSLHCDTTFPSFIIVVIEVPLNLQPVSAESEQGTCPVFTPKLP